MPLIGKGVSVPVTPASLRIVGVSGYVGGVGRSEWAVRGWLLASEVRRCERSENTPARQSARRVPERINNQITPNVRTTRLVSVDPVLNHSKSDQLHSVSGDRFGPDVTPLRPAT